jgi:hypothetical protein
MANAGRRGHLEWRRRGGRAATYRVLQAVHRNGKRGGMHDVQTVHRVVLKQCTLTKCIEYVGGPFADV